MRSVNEEEMDLLLFWPFLLREPVLFFELLLLFSTYPRRNMTHLPVFKTMLFQELTDLGG